MLTLVISIALFIALVVYLIVIYNLLVTLKNNVSRNWSNIDVLLRQRYSELPKLIDTCKEYMQYEKETLEKVVAARNAAASATNGRNLKALGQAENLLKSGLTQLFALAENYPDLKANQSFQKLQTRISELENDIADRRELYNDSANRINIRIHQFPDLLVAKLFSFTSADLLKFSEAEIQDIGVQNNFKDK